MIRVFVVAPTALACDAIATSLRGEAGIQVIGRSVGYNASLPDLPEECVVLIDVGAPDLEVRVLVHRLYRDHPDVRVVVFGVPDAAGIVLDYLEAGAQGYVPRDESIATLVERVRAVDRDEALLSPDLAGLLVRRVAGLSRLCTDNDLDATRASALSPREREVLHHIASGRSNQEISRRLGIGLGTVKNHVHSLLRKLGVTRREDAGLYWRLFVQDRPESDPNLPVGNRKTSTNRPE